jgi:hypothetical protein
MQQLNKWGRTNDVYLSVYSSIKEHGKLPDNGHSKQYYHRYVNRLRKEGIIARRGYGVWVALKGLEELNKTPQDGKKIRAHGFTFKVRLPKITNWHNRKEFLDKKKIPYKDLNKFQSIVFRKHAVWLCTKTLVIYMPEGLSFYSDTAIKGQQYAIYNLEQMLIGLENLLGVSLRIGKHFQFKISKQHYAKIKDVLAIQCNKDNVKMRCYYNGEGWLVIDNSFNLHELETDNPNTAQSDMDEVVIPLFNNAKDYKEKTGQAPNFLEINKSIEEMRATLFNGMDTLVKAQLVAQNQITLTQEQILALVKMLTPKQPEIKQDDTDDKSYFRFYTG